MIPSTGHPCWSYTAIECSDIGSNSSLLLSWFDLSTLGYGLSNKAWHGWGNHVLMNRIVLRQETSRTACVSNHLGGRSSVGSHGHRFHQHIVFYTWCMLSPSPPLPTPQAIALWMRTGGTHSEFWCNPCGQGQGVCGPKGSKIHFV